MSHAKRFETSDPASQPLAAILLCGGRSQRMGRPKATLPFGPRTMLQQVVARLDEAPRRIDPIVVVAAVDQRLPPVQRTGGGCLVARDQRPARGPLEGLIAGMQALATWNQEQAGRGQPTVQAAFASSCDVPLLCPNWPHAVARRLVEAKADAAVPVDNRHHHPLAAVYSLATLPVLKRLSDQDELRPRKLFDLVSTVRLPVEELRAVDPELETLMNLNTPADYLRALERQGLPRPEGVFAPEPISDSDSP